MDTLFAEQTNLSELEAISVYKAVSVTAFWVTGWAISPIDLGPVIHPWTLLAEPFSAYVNITVGQALLEPYIAPHTKGVTLEHLLDDIPPTDSPYTRLHMKLLQLLVAIPSDERAEIGAAREKVLEEVVELQVIDDLQYEFLESGSLSEEQVRGILRKASLTFQSFKKFTPLDA